MVNAVFISGTFPPAPQKTVWKQIDEVRMDQSQEYLGKILSITNLEKTARRELRWLACARKVAEAESLRWSHRDVWWN